MKDIAFTSAAYRQMRKLTTATRAQINAKLDTYAETESGDVKALKGVDGFRLRSGDWRILFTISDDTIVVHAVGAERFTTERQYENETGPHRSVHSDTRRR